MRVRLLALLIAFGALWTAHAAVPLPVMACSCGVMPLKELRGDAQTVAFTGDVVAAGAGGVEVRVAHWYQGEATPTVTLHPDGFGMEGGMCQIGLPRVGSRWTWVASRDPEGRSTYVNLCTRQAEQGTNEAKVLEREVRDAFGKGRPVAPEPEEAPARVAPSPLSTPGAELVVLGAVGLVVIVLFGGVVLLARRGDRSPG